MRTPIDRRELAAQLQKLGQRGGLADEWRLEREAPLLLKLTERLLDLVSQPGDDTRPEEPAEEQQLKPDERPVTVRALQLLGDVLPNFSPTSGALLRAGLNLDRLSDTTKDQRIVELAQERYLPPSQLLERERGLYQPLADFLLEEVAIVRSRRAHEAMEPECINLFNM